MQINANPTVGTVAAPGVRSVCQRAVASTFLPLPLPRAATLSSNTHTADTATHTHVESASRFLTAPTRTAPDRREPTASELIQFPPLLELEPTRSAGLAEAAMKPRDLLDRLTRPFSSSASRRESASVRREEEDLEAIAAREQRAFRYEALVAATRNFGPKQKLGQGGFGPVYRGRLDDGREVAVKRLGAGSRQGAREFKNEATLLSRVQHRNVVNLLGYCAHGADEKLLVYEYVPNESLDKILFSAAAAPPSTNKSHSSSSSEGDRQLRAELTWPRRLEVVVGVARGLLYLHEDAHTPIIHRDIKASNILLDDRWVAKIADFGMARLYPEAGDGRTHVQTRVAGTNGYMAPEYLMHGHLSAKADVFSFGVLVLEIVSGRKNSAFIPPPGSDADNLLDYAWKLYKKGRSMELLDPYLKSAAEPEQVLLCIRIGLLCVQADPRLRPDMKRVVIILSKKQSTLEEPTRPGAPGSRYRRRAHGLRSSQYSDGSSSGTTPSTSATSHASTSHASASASNATTATSSTTNLRSLGVPSHRQGKELPNSG